MVTGTRVRMWMWSANGISSSDLLRFHSKHNLNSILKVTFSFVWSISLSRRFLKDFLLPLFKLWLRATWTQEIAVFPKCFHGENELQPQPDSLSRDSQVARWKYRLDAPINCVNRSIIETSTESILKATLDYQGCRRGDWVLHCLIVERHVSMNLFMK